MEVYLPIAGISINVLFLAGLGCIVGFMSGLFGVGGGFIMTPLMMMAGIPPAVAAASDSNQIVAGAASGAYAHWRLRNVDFKMGCILLVGGLVGGTLGVQLVKLLRELGNIEFVMKLLYVIMLSLIGGLMFMESLSTIRRTRSRPSKSEPQKKKKTSIWSRLPLQTYFAQSNLRTSIIFPFLISCFVGALAALLGVGGGFIMVPAMIYVIGMPTIVAVGTDLFQIVMTTANITFQQALTNQTVDLLLAMILLLGSTIGAQLGARVGRLLRGEQIRILLATIVLLFAVKFILDLVLTPSNVIALVGGGGGH